MRRACFLLALGMMAILFFGIAEAQEAMTPEEAAAAAEEDAAMEKRFLPVCIDYYSGQLAQAHKDSAGNRFHRQQYLEHCIANMKEQAKKQKEEEEKRRQEENVRE